LQTDQLLREHSHRIAVTAGPTKVHPHVAANGPAQARKRLRERREARLRQRIVFAASCEHADAPDAPGPLRARRERPRRRAAEPSDEFAPSKANAHLALPCEGTLSRQNSTAKACGPLPSGAGSGRSDASWPICGDLCFPALTVDPNGGRPLHPLTGLVIDQLIIL
jgi:hypothetical protein